MLAFLRLRFRLADMASLGRHHEGRTLVLDEEGEKLGRLRLAGIAADDMDIIRPLVEGLTGVEGDRRRALHLHDDRAFEHVDENVRVVPVDGVRRSRRVLTIMIAPSLPAMPVRSCEKRGVTFVVCAVVVWATPGRAMEINAPATSNDFIGVVLCLAEWFAWLNQVIVPPHNVSPSCARPGIPAFAGMSGICVTCFQLA